MITETQTHNYGKCSSKDIVRNGRNRYGNQLLVQELRYLSCVSVNVEISASHARATRRVKRIYQERSSMRGVERATSVLWHTVASWIKKVSLQR